MADAEKGSRSGEGDGVKGEEPLTKRARLGGQEVASVAESRPEQQEEEEEEGGESGWESASCAEGSPEAGAVGAEGRRRRRRATAAAAANGGLGPQPPHNKEPHSEGLAESGPESRPSAGEGDSLLLSNTVSSATDEEIVPNGIHSWESDEEDKASHASSSDWAPGCPKIGPYSFVQQHLMLGTDPRSILKDLLRGNSAPPDLDDMTLWQIVLNILSEPPKRKKRKDINTIEDVVKMLRESKKIMVLTGAGVSVSCGIPDFRSRDGIYARLAVDFPDLPDPHAMFDIEYFRKDPRPFFKFAKEIYPGQFQPSLCHRFIALLDKQQRLLRNYTQNIDTLEQVTGIHRIVECHGSFAMASCLACKYKVDCEAIRKDVFNQVVPQCPRCPPDVPLAIMKPDIVFFGENLPELFHRSMKYDKDEVDLLIVIGSSLKVRPVALIPSSIPHDVPQVLINREPLSHLNFDVELLGDCDVIINELCHRLSGEFEELCCNPIKLTEITVKPVRCQKELKCQSFGMCPTPTILTEDSSSYEKEIQSSKSAISTAKSYEHMTESAESCTKENKEESGVETLSSEKEMESTVSFPESSGNCNNELQITKPTEESSSNLAPVDTKPVNKEILNKGCISKNAKEQISKRLGDSQYLFLAPNRYIFHGAEVYSDSEGDEGSSSGNSVSNSDNESSSSKSVCDVVEEESDIEEFYNRIEDEIETPYSADGVYFGDESEHFENADELNESVENHVQSELEDANILE
ncbi:NAD-dependent protein deacetylase sirtuin-1 [Callorhinchus milii]|uniref:NAD-dependent protein deacetylase sirtuin-1 n=1 Tax=Callorhinchus milii TaxID=7868 RepID=UPI001C3FC56C|nr:NAD-dependent protein deacetylase sirtuin-1 [Callorhinchus milii]